MPEAAYMPLEAKARMSLAVGPPGLSDKDTESATASRERRRVGLAGKVIADALWGRFDARLQSVEVALGRIESKLDAAAVRDEVVERMECKHTALLLAEHSELLRQEVRAEMELLAAKIESVSVVGVALKRSEEVGAKDVTCNSEFFGVMTADAAVQVGEVVGLHRQLRVGISDVSTAESSNGCPRPAEAWMRLAVAALASNRLDSLRGFAFAPASSRAMVYRSCDHSSSGDESRDGREPDAADDAASIASTELCEHPTEFSEHPESQREAMCEDDPADAAADELNSSDDEEYEVDPAMETFIDVLVSGVGKDGIKKAFIFFIQDRVAHGSATAEAREEATAVLRFAAKINKMSEPS